MKKKIITIILILILVISAVIYASCAGGSAQNNLNAQTAEGGSEKNSGDGCDDCLNAEMGCLNAELDCLNAEVSAINDLGGCNGCAGNSGAFISKIFKKDK